MASVRDFPLAVQTALAEAQLRLILQARASNTALGDAVRAQASSLDDRCVALLNAKPDPRDWTADEHLLVIQAALPRAYAVTSVPARPWAEPAPSNGTKEPPRTIDSEIPF